jgi:hypothetical protein
MTPHLKCKMHLALAILQLMNIKCIASSHVELSLKEDRAPPLERQSDIPKALRGSA